jgi:hypothetical protein
MTRSEILRHLGPYISQPYLADLCDLVERVWEMYREHATEYGNIAHGSRQYLFVRMMYIAEVTSNGIRLNATWSLIPAAMSLLRDRYEQAVRFSWLVRSLDDEEFLKYERAIFGKINALVRNVDNATVSRFEETMGPIPSWVTEPLSKEQRAYLDAWNALDLRSMAQKRDALPPITDTPLAKRRLASWYNSVYAQFSSVSHYGWFRDAVLAVYGGRCAISHIPEPRLLHAAHIVVDAGRLKWPAVNEAPSRGLRRPPDWDRPRFPNSRL